MAIDQVAKVVVQFKGDTSDLKEKLRDLQGEEKRLAGEQLKRVEASNRGIESQIAMLGRMGAIAGSIGAVVVGAFAAMEKAAEHQRLATQAGRVDLERLSAAAGHTKSEMQLLSDAAKLQTAAFKPNQQQMEMVEKAIRQLARENGNLDEVTKRVTESVVKLEGEGLKEYGIRVREATSDSDKFNAIMEALGKKAGTLSDESLTAAESTAKLRASFTDAVDKTVEGLGRLAAALTPMLEGLAGVVGLAGQIAGGILTAEVGGVSVGDVGASVYKWTNPLYQLYRGGKALKNAVTGNERAAALGDWDWTDRGDVAGGMVDPAQIRLGLVRQTDAGPNLWDSSSDDISAAQGEIIAQQIRNAFDPRTFEESQKAVKDAAEAQLEALNAKLDKAEAYAKSPEGKREWVRVFLEANTALSGGNTAIPGFLAADRAYRDFLGGGGNDTGGLGSRSGAQGRFGFAGRDRFGLLGNEEEAFSRIIDNTESERLTEQWNAQMDRMRGVDRGEGAGIKAAQKSQLESIFGPLTEFDAYAKGFQMLTGASQAAFSAWIDGSMSAGEAIKKFFAESLKGMAVDLLGKALLHGVYAVGSLAFGDVRGAAQHGQAAAMAAAGAIALGGLAKALGPGAGAAPGAASTGGGRGGLTEAGPGARGALLGYETEQRGSHQIIVVGDPHALDSPRRRAANFREMARFAEGQNGVVAR